MDKTILLVDDDKEIRELLRLYLEKDGYVVVQAENGRDALEKTQEHTPCLAVIDIMMPEMDGYELTRTLRAKSSIPIIVISAKSEYHEKILGLDLGADDYVTKPFDPMEVLARIRAQLRRYNDLEGTENDILTVGLVRLDTTSCTLCYGQDEISLTKTEYNMMLLFFQNPGRVFTKQQIYEAAWQDTVIVDDNTVMVAISKLRSKLPQNGAVAIITIRGLGYRLEVKA